MNERQRLSKLMAEADANADQARKDGRSDAAKQWSALAAEYGHSLAEIAKAHAKKLIEEHRKSRPELA